MTFRTRVLLASAPVALLPLLVFGFGVRRAVIDRLSAEYRRRVDALAAVVREDLRAQDQTVASRLATVRAAATDDDRLRLAVRGVVVERPYLLDFAVRAMRAAGLDLLQLQDADGRILSSGHFRNEFDRLEPALPALLGHAGGGALLRGRRPEGTFLAMARLDSLLLGDRKVWVVGGVAVDSSFLSRLARDTTLAVRLAIPDATPEAVTDGGAVVASVLLPFVDPAVTYVEQARIDVVHGGAELAALRREVGIWFLVAVLATGAAALLLAGWLASRAVRPLAEVERRAALGDLARQVNHDVKNGLTPLRNVVRHLSEVAAREPSDLARVYAERRSTLDSSLAYLETLAANYARLYPRGTPAPTDVNAVIRDALTRVSVTPARIAAVLSESLPPVRIDPLALRRILENLVGNAVESLDGAPQGGSVTVASTRAGNTVRLTVADTGRGMTRAELDRAFEDFQTTKAGGTGLGLSIVRRLVMDAGGSLRVETEPGKGSRFIVELPT